MQDALGIARSTSSAITDATDEGDEILYASSDENIIRQSSSSSSEPVLYDTSDDGLEVSKQAYAKNRRKAYSLSMLGKSVCSRAYPKLLGIGDSTIEKKSGLELLHSPTRPDPPVLSIRFWGLLWIGDASGNQF